MFIFAVAGVLYFGEQATRDVEHWGDLGSALLTIFGLITLDSWVDLLRKVDGLGVAYSRLFPIIFILVGHFIFFSMFIRLVIMEVEVMASIAAAKARAEVAQKRAAYSKKVIKMEKARVEAEAEMEKARLDATLDALEKERKSEAALAEAVVMEAAVADLEIFETENKVEFQLPPRSSQQRTEEYAIQISYDNDNLYPEDVTSYHNREFGVGQHANPHHNLPSSHWSSCHSAHDAMPTMRLPSDNPAHYINSNTATLDLAKYLARSQLESSGLFRFDDRPENDLAWRSTFLSTVKDLDLTAGEEFDLLIKWLGKESAEQARRIKSANVRSLSAGLQLMWERLDETYGSNFPRMVGRETQKLCELSDLLLGLEVAKQDGYLPGLLYLDTARGVNPIVEKLPYGLQEKWMTQGLYYEQEHRVLFPPFSFFTEFVHREAKACNDPSFSLVAHASPTEEKSLESAPVMYRHLSLSIKRTSL
ncbi:hypothetical protein AOLI_G00046540 [Acnodon oligacanthus]